MGVAADISRWELLHMTGGSGVALCNSELPAGKALPLTKGSHRRRLEVPRQHAKRCGVLDGGVSQLVDGSRGVMPP